MYIYIERETETETETDSCRRLSTLIPLISSAYSIFSLFLHLSVLDSSVFSSLIFKFSSGRIFHDTFQEFISFSVVS